MWPGTSRPASAEDYSDVLIPLEEAHLHSHSARLGRTEFEEPPGEDSPGQGYDEDDDGKDGEHEGRGMLEMRAAEYSIEGLRREVRRGEKGQVSDYESKFAPWRARASLRHSSMSW